MNEEEQKEYTLPKEFAERWVRALRSGEYGQAAGTLHYRDTDCYCCLGVAAKICGAEESRIDKYDVLDRSGSFEQFGIPDILIKDIAGAEFVDTLTSMNDGYETKQLSFPEIADWLEANVNFA